MIEVMKLRNSLLVAAACATVGVATMPKSMPRANAVPAPEVEYLYNVAARKHFNFPDNDALVYGHGICDKISGGEGYAQIMGDVKRDVTPSDEASADYLVSYAVNILCPAEIWQLRNSASGYRPPA